MAKNSTIADLEARVRRLESRMTLGRGDADWIDVASFDNNWSQYVGSLYQVRYRKLPTGLVVVDGLVDPSSATGDVAFRLPAGYRPAKNVYTNTIQSGGTTPRLLWVDNLGDVRPSYVGSGWVSVHMTFLADG